MDFLNAEGWGKLSVPLGLVMLVVTSAYAGANYLSSTYLRISDFEQFQTQMELRLLDSQRQQLETDILRLSVKRDVYPKQFDAVDKAILAKQQVTLAETQSELSRLNDRRREHRK